MPKIVFFRDSRPLWKLVAIVCIGILIVSVALVSSNSHDLPRSNTEFESSEADKLTKKSKQVRTAENLVKSALNPKTVSTKSIASIGEALNSFQAPDRPVWILLESYARSNTHTLEEDINIISSLSYCVNLDDAPELLRDLRASGKALPEEVVAIESSINTARPLCERLSDADFAIRSKILRTWADRGDTEGMLGFFEAGPPGGWKVEGRDENNSAAALQWRSETIAYLERAMNMGRVEAFATLAEIYRPRIEKGSVFFGIENPGLSYAYGYAYAVALVSSATDEEVKSGLRNYVMQLSSSLSPEEKTEAEAIAKSMLEKCCGDK